MNNWKTIADIRREYGDLSLNEENVDKCPLMQFKVWFAEVLALEKSDPTALTLSTVDKDGRPDSRVVLLKGIEENCFIFYTNYQSQKARQLNHSPYAALNFYWPQMSRQVRVRGRVERVSKEQSDAYFSSRPLTSQLSAIASPQSQPIANRQILEEALDQLIATQAQEAKVTRPQHWGGYKVIPEEMEFWQGRDNRLHDRILYYQAQGKWAYCRLAP